MLRTLSVVFLGLVVLGGCGGRGGRGRGGEGMRDAGPRDTGPVIDIDTGPGGCTAPLLDCGSGCVDVTRDPRNCGFCGNICALDESCTASTCTAGGCGGGLTDCGAAGCVDTDRDPSNCGVCGRRCAATETCSSGACTASGCSFPLEDCFGSCVDTRTDRNNCGGCGVRCATGESCVDSFCEGPSGCTVGVGCTAARGCSVGECIEEAPGTIGETGDTIRGEPTGRTTIPITSWVGGYCVPALPTAGAPEACTLDDPSTCPSCATCVDAGGGATLCLQACTPAATGLGGCRAGYTCDFGSASCWPGCGSDDECHVYREDTNGDGVIEAPAAGGTAVDRLVWDPAAGITCNATTGRCEHRDGGVRAGQPCTRSSQCEVGGTCIAAWPGGGYCSKFGCDVAGISCTAPSVCQERRIGLAICGTGCTVGAEASMPSLRLGATGHGVGCRAGYACVWDGVDGVGVPNNGLCIPGEYNSRTINNVGDACTTDADCFSPFGYGACIFAPTGSCSILDCAAPGIPADVCGAGRVCAGGFPDNLAICLESCTTSTTCATGYTCQDGATLGLTGTTGSVCWPT